MAWNTDRTAYRLASEWKPCSDEDIIAKPLIQERELANRSLTPAKLVSSACHRTASALPQGFPHSPQQTVTYSFSINQTYHLLWSTHVLEASRHGRPRRESRTIRAAGTDPPLGAALGRWRTAPSRTDSAVGANDRANDTRHGEVAH